MPLYKASHRSEDEDDSCPEIVGSKDLREVFKEKDRLRGSFSINGYMFNQFETNSIENLLGQLEDKAGFTHVKASIDDGYHLVLEANSPALIVLVLGPAYVEPTLPISGGIADEVLSKMEQKYGRNREGESKPATANTILEDLGLPESDTKDNPAAVPGVPPPGMSADERQKARQPVSQAAASAPAPNQTQPPKSDWVS